MRIAFCGPAGGGKTTAANILLEKYGGFRKSFAAALKADAYHYGWDGKKDLKGRTFLQLLGHVVRTYNPNYWANRVRDDIEMLHLPSANIFIDDLRFPNEVKILRDLGFTIVYLDAINLPDADAEWRKDPSEQFDKNLADYAMPSYIGDMEGLRRDLIILVQFIEEEEAFEQGG